MNFLMNSNEKKLFLPWSEKSSTKTISFKSAVGDLFITEWTVLSMVVRASLWNMMITLADGNCFGYSIFKHLKLKYFNEYSLRQSECMYLHIPFSTQND